MWLTFLKDIQSYIHQTFTDPDDARKLEHMTKLLEYAANFQSQPVEYAAVLVEAAQAWRVDRGSIQRIEERLQQSAPVNAVDSLFLSHCATLLELLESSWELYYANNFSIYPEVGQVLEEVVVFLRKLPFNSAMQAFEAEWISNDVNEELTIAILLYVRSCALIEVYGTPALYYHIANQLRFDNDFLTVFLAAACMKLRNVSLQVNTGEWSQEQYSCLKLFDNFHFLPDTAWG